MYICKEPSIYDVQRNQVFDSPVHMRPHEPDTPHPPCGRPHAVDVKYTSLS